MKRPMSITGKDVPARLLTGIRAVFLIAALVSMGSCELLEHSKPLRRPLGPTVSVPKGEPAAPQAPAALGTSSTIALSTDTESQNSKFPGGVKPAPVIIPGTGMLAAPPQAAQDQQAEAELPPAPQEQNIAVTLNFVDADIRELLKSVLGDMLSLNYVVAPEVAGTITLKTNTPLQRDELLPALENVLELNGFVLVKNDNTYSVLPASGVSSLPILAAKQEIGFGLEILRLHHVSATSMKAVLDQYASSGAVRVVDDAKGLIAVAASGPDRLKIRELIDVFDVDQLSGMSFGLFPVSAAEPAEIIAELDTIFNPTNETAQNGVLKFLPVDRLSSVLVIASRPNDLRSAGVWIDRLDHRIVSDQPRLYVHYVQHGQAKNIAATLQAIFGGQQTTVEPGIPPAGGTVAPNQMPGEIGQPAAGEGQPLESQFTQGAFRNAPSNRLPMSGIGQAESGSIAGEQEFQAQAPSPLQVNSTTSPGRRIRITADVPNNALFIMATPQDFRDIEAAIEHLDTEPLQVLIEATIAEVTLNDKLKYGVEWFFQQGNSTFDLSQLASGIPTAVFPGFAYIYQSSNAKIVLNALDAVTNVNVISSPQLMVLDNRSATLQVGDEVPIITQSAVSVTDPAAPIVNSVELRDTGVILTVTPRVNTSGGVELDIEQEVSDVVPTTTSNIDSPTIQQRKVKSSVSVHDGGTIALGGLIRDSQTRGKSGIPVLSDIPVVGTLFGTRNNENDRTELLILITPHVIRNPKEADAVTEELRQRVQTLLPLTRKIE
jgi:general secretion pathway protein D